MAIGTVRNLCVVKGGVLCKSAPSRRRYRYGARLRGGGSSGGPSASAGTGKTGSVGEPVAGAGVGVWARQWHGGFGGAVAAAAEP
jgi:hypothetical protein